MARFHGKVGFLICEDDQETGIVRNRAVEKPFYGKVMEHSRRWQTSDVVTEDLTLGNQIAITATDYAFRHASAIVYICYMGQRWKVTAIRVKGPEIILTMGGVYNGEIPEGFANAAAEAGA